MDENTSTIGDYTNDKRMNTLRKWANILLIIASAAVIFLVIYLTWWVGGGE